MEPRWMFTLATVLGALGMWLMLPRGTAPGRSAGALLMAAALGLWGSQLLSTGTGVAAWIGQGVFFVLAGVTLVSAAATVTFRNPVYCAVWFGMSLLGTAGLMLLVGAQFLAAATVLVYAGAILVTFLFVLMLAQPEGRAHYDRVAWEPLLSAVTGLVIVGILSMTVSTILTQQAEGGRPAMATVASRAGERSDRILSEQHVARIGAELFGRHLVAVEVAGTILLVALVAAAVIVARPKVRSTESPPGAPQATTEP